MAVPHQYIFRIQNSYLKSAADITEINSDMGNSKKWEKGYSGFKANIRIHLKSEQNNRCAFCRCRVSVGTSYSNLEHLVSKTDYPQFKFEPNNIVYCCTRCNLAKVKSNTLENPVVDKSLQPFPIASNGFSIINPYFDDFENYIDFIDDIIIVVVNNSRKGKETISLYKLFRPELAEERAYELKLNQKQLTRQLLNRLTDTNVEQDTINQITEIVNQIPTWVL